MRRVVVSHGEERSEPLPLGAAIEILADREHAVIEAIGLADDRELVGIDRAVLDPALPVEIEHRACGGLAGLQALQRVTLSADVITVLADQDVEAPDGHVCT